MNVMIRTAKRIKKRNMIEENFMIRTAPVYFEEVVSLHCRVAQVTPYIFLALNTFKKKSRKKLNTSF